MKLFSKELLLNSGGDKMFTLPLYDISVYGQNICFFPSEVNASLSAYPRETIKGISGEIGLAGSSIQLIDRLITVSEMIKTASFVGKEVYMGLEFAVYRYSSAYISETTTFDVYVHPKAIIGDLFLVKDSRIVVTAFSDSSVSVKINVSLLGWQSYTLPRNNNSSIEYIYRA